MRWALGGKPPRAPGYFFYRQVTERGVLLTHGQYPGVLAAVHAELAILRHPCARSKKFTYPSVRKGTGLFLSSNSLPHQSQGSCDAFLPPTHIV